MGLDVTVRIERPVFCPHCGEVVDWKAAKKVESFGRVWFDYLEFIGYYIPYEIMQKTGKQDKYGQDVVLTNDQIKMMKSFLMHNDVPYGNIIYEAIRDVVKDSHGVVINADW